jgi:hypothetical protein
MSAKGRSRHYIRGSEEDIMFRKTAVGTAAALVVSASAMADVMLCSGGMASQSFDVTGQTKIAAECTIDAASDGDILVIASSASTASRAATRSDSR